MAWRTRQSAEIPRDEWLARLDAVPNASPYLLPEWSQFWTDAWTNSRAEAFDDGATLIPVVRRQRFGLVWRFAQPYGTDGIIGPTAEIDTRGLLDLFCGDRTVEFAISAPLTTEMPGWSRRALTQNSWTIKTAGKTYTQLSQEFSGSHRKNISKGEELQLRIDESPDSATLIRKWRDTHRAPRYMLNPTHAPALIRRFTDSGALHWRTGWVGERPVAGTIFLHYKNVAVSVDTIVDRDPQFRGAGHYLVAHSLKSLMDSGITLIDMGGVPGGADHPGLNEFKSGWSSIPETVLTTLYRRNWYARIKT